MRSSVCGRSTVALLAGMLCDRVNESLTLADLARTLSASPRRHPILHARKPKSPASRPSPGHLERVQHTGLLRRRISRTPATSASGSGKINGNDANARRTLLLRQLRECRVPRWHRSSAGHRSVDQHQWLFRPASMCNSPGHRGDALLAVCHRPQVERAVGHALDSGPTPQLRNAIG